MNTDIGQYKIFNEIGKGSFGKVFKGIDKLTGEEVALKFIQKKQKRSRDIKNLRQQNQLLKKINHPNVICLKDVIETQKEIIIVTDYAGRDLSGIIQEVKKFPLQKVKDFSIQILKAMLYLNDNRIIHRDLKPQNILVKNNHIKICDFGFAKKLSASTNFLQSMKGTPLYLAPQIVRETKYTEKVDIWSFGCIIYELFTGRTPYYANTYQKLAPLILYQQVQYPKEMPVQLRELISSMLQKNPSARPNWKQLSEHSFFRQHEALRQRIENCPKDMISLQTAQRLHPDYFNKQNQGRQPQTAQVESKVIQKLDNQNQIKGYLEEFKKIYAQLIGNKIEGTELRRDVIFLHKIKTVFHERSQLNILISNQLLQTIFNILIQLIKTKKASLTQKQPENLTAEEDDITRNEALIIGILCIAKVQKNFEMLQKELKIICLLIKSNFNGLAINTDIDEEITQFVTEILLQNSTNLPVQCIRNGLIIIGTLVNQAMMTINNSFSYFERIAQDNLISKIARIFKKQQKHAIVLQCLKQFIHPVRQIPSTNGNHPHYVLQARMKKIFETLKEQASESLLKTDFLSQRSPLQSYSEKSSNLIDYCQVLLECLSVSKEMRKQFLKHNYWSDFLSNKKTKIFLFAYNQIFIKEEDKCIIPKESMANFTKESQENKLINIYIVEMGYDNLKKKSEKAKDRQSILSILAFEKSILQKISEFLFLQESIKLKSCKEIYGTLQTTSKKFDQPIIEMFFSIAQNLKNVQNSEQNKELVQNVFKKICNTNNPFRPNNKSLHNLITLFVENDIIKALKSEKNIHIFFYQCISDFIRREDFEYLENQFQNNFVSAFIAKIIKCLNYLIEVEEVYTKGTTTNLSQNAIGLSKQIQTSSFYRFMFIDDLKENQFYEHLRYCQKIITKTAQVAAQFMNFLGVKVIPMCRNYIGTKNQNVIIEMCMFLSYMARDHTQFNNEIMGIQIIKNFKEWMIDESYGEGLKEKVLYLVGNLAKRSEFFFNEFQANSVLEGITICLQRHYINTRIFKNTIYSVGNISFYSQKFYKQIEPMIPYFAKAFDMNDPHLKNNLISTVSNLLRFSNIYLSELIKTGMIHNVLKIACQSKQLDQVLANLILSLIKKIIPYDEFYKEFGFKDLRIIYQRRQIFGGEANQTIRKIKDILQKNRQDY